MYALVDNELLRLFVNSMYITRTVCI